MNDPWTAPTGPYNAAVDLIDRHHTDAQLSKVAFLDPGRSLTYAALQDRTRRFAAALAALGIQREQRLVLVMLDTVDFPVVFWGAIRAGVVAVPLNTLLPSDQWRYMIDDSRAAGVVISSDLFERAAPMLNDIRSTRPLHVIVAGAPRRDDMLDLETVLAESSPLKTPVDTHADEIAFWLYTSGSTGAPKGARHVHASPIATAELYARRVQGITADDVMFSAAKLFFAYGLGNSMSGPLSVGATAVLLPDRPTADSVLANLERHQPSIFCGVPTLYAALLAHNALSHGAGSSRLRVCVSAGEPLPEEIGRRWRRVVGVDILDGIGSTEMLHIFISNRAGDVRYGSSGTPIPGYEARIITEGGQDASTGEVGELVVKGPTAADGYWNQRQRSRRTFAGEWTYTGDKYRTDEQGYYYYCGRTDDMFKVSGNWVSPFEVESALVSHPAVLEAAVVGQADVDGLIKPKAFVVLKPGFDGGEPLFEQLKSHVKQVAGPWKYPRWIEVRDELPKTATGKIQRFRLRAE